MWAYNLLGIYTSYIGLHIQQSTIIINLYAAIHDVVFNPFYEPIKSLLFGMKWLFKHQDLQMFGLKLNIYI